MSRGPWFYNMVPDGALSQGRQLKAGVAGEGARSGWSSLPPPTETSLLVLCPEPVTVGKLGPRSKSCPRGPVPTPLSSSHSLQPLPSQQQVHAHVRGT